MKRLFAFLAFLSRYWRMISVPDNDLIRYSNSGYTQFSIQSQKRERELATMNESERKI